MYSESLFNTLYRGKTQMLKKNSFGQNKRYKKCTLFFFREFQLITVLLLMRGSYLSASTKLTSLKVCVGFSIFGSDFIKVYIFIQQKS